MGTSRCRFYPSCSQYAKEAINMFGTKKGAILALKRLIRCNQWFEGGYDPIVDRKRKIGHNKAKNSCG